MEFIQWTFNNVIRPYFIEKFVLFSPQVLMVDDVSPDSSENICRTEPGLKLNKRSSPF